MSREAILLLLAVALLAAIGLFGWWPIVAECGRLPHGGGETLNRLLGLWRGCA